MKFVATWMDLEIIMISEKSMKKTNIVWYHLRVESKKQEKQNKAKTGLVYREQIGRCQRKRGGVGEKSEPGQKIQTYKIDVMRT